MKATEIVKAVFRDERDGKFVLETMDGAKHKVSTDMLIAAGISAAASTIGEPYPFKDDDQGNAVEFVPHHESDLDAIGAKIGSDTKLKPLKEVGEPVMVDGFAMYPVKGSNIAAAGYLAEPVMVMRVTFKGHTPRTYAYQNVEPAVFAAMMDAESPGKYLKNEIEKRLGIKGTLVEPPKPTPVEEVKTAEAKVPLITSLATSTKEGVSGTYIATDDGKTHWLSDEITATLSAGILTDTAPGKPYLFTDDDQGNVTGVAGRDAPLDATS